MFSLLASLHSSVSDDQHDQKHDGQQKLTDDEQVHSKKTKTSQLVQEEKAQSGNVSRILQGCRYAMMYL